MTTPALKRFCKHCDYSLAAIAGTTCPECGRGFDPADPATFAKRPNSRLRRWGRRGVVVMVALLVLYAFAPSRVARLVWAWPNADGTTATWQVRWCVVGPRWLPVKYPRWNGERGTKTIEPRGLVFSEFEFWEVKWFSVERGIRGACNVPGVVGRDGVVRSTSPIPVARRGFAMVFDIAPEGLGALDDEMLRPPKDDVPSMHVFPLKKVPGGELAS